MHLLQRAHMHLLRCVQTRTYHAYAAAHAHTHTPAAARAHMQHNMNKANKQQTNRVKFCLKTGRWLIWEIDEMISSVMGEKNLSNVFGDTGC